MERKYELYHHGILGMHWGIRRFQNEDGTLTAEGKKRYSSGSERNRIINDIENGASNYSKYVDKVKAVSKECLPFSANHSLIVDMVKKDPSIKNRVNEAARLGQKAFGQDSFGDQEWADSMDFKDWRDWFLFEDQTFGMGMICDLINQGYSASQCKKLIDIVEKGDYYDFPKNKDYELASCVAFDIQEGNYKDRLKEWADIVEHVKKNGK